MTASALSYKEHEVCITTAAGGKKEKKKKRMAKYSQHSRGKQ